MCLILRPTITRMTIWVHVLKLLFVRELGLVLIDADEARYFENELPDTFPRSSGLILEERRRNELMGDIAIHSFNSLV